ncbi:MAG: CPBP family intramembrane metalloprotease [Actinobacteria bacterium]|nr:CPBP family intramembrane metalloprotease [Actinomycetota bacterium]
MALAGLEALAIRRPPPGLAYPQVLTDEPWTAQTLVRGLFGAVLGLLTFFALTPVVVQLVLLAGWNLAGRPGDFAGYHAAGLAFELPMGMVASHLGLAVLLPTALALVLVVHHVHPRWLHSVRPGFRWRYALAALLIATVVLNAVMFLGAAGWAWELRPQPDFGWFLLVILLTSPLQAAAEEYFFRGYLLQALQSALRAPWLGVVASALIFALLHGTQNLPLFLDRFGFGLLAGFLVARTGGLEAAIAAHVANNVFAFVWAGLTTSIAAVKATQVIGWLDLATDLLGFGLFALAAIWLGRRMKLATTTP